jgi:hypothetical protein
VRLDPAVIDQPVQHLGRAVSGVADQALGIQIEALSERSIMRCAARISA